uniref:Uncharacterized protein n=1 Tax=Cucumis melo TaxID=3656 RepID=A0A9I9DIU7_CUCME
MAFHHKRRSRTTRLVSKLQSPQHCPPRTTGAPLTSITDFRAADPLRTVDPTLLHN